MEEWLPIKDYENLYLVSNTGKIKNALTNKVLKGALNSKTAYTQYRFVQLYKPNTKRKTAYIHLLVFDTFVGTDRTGYEVDHIDNNQENNSLSNLQLISHRANCIKDRKSAGVSYDKTKKLWIARMQIKGKMKYLGSAKDKEKAQQLYKAVFDSFGGV